MKQSADELAEKVADTLRRLDAEAFDVETSYLEIAQKILHDLNLEQLLADKERLDWLEKRTVANIMSQRLACYFTNLGLNDTWRTAIDSAIAAQGKDSHD